MISKKALGRITSVFVVLFVAGALLLAYCLGGCAARQKNITALPAGVTQTQAQNWDAAVADLDKIAQTVSAARQTLITFNQTSVTDSTGTHKLIPDGKVYGAILTSFGKIDQAEQDAVVYLKAQPQNWSVSTQQKVQNDIKLIQAELSAITTQQLAGIKNANAQGQLQQFISELGGFATLILGLQ